ncbi:MAG: DUF2283 domain-containing protein [Anaerolineaceae bacterium]|nr:DUF2283 domain-containing protein [Anaerolineaceae bacterium]
MGVSAAQALYIDFTPEQVTGLESEVLDVVGGPELVIDRDKDGVVYGIEVLGGLIGLRDGSRLLSEPTSSSVPSPVPASEPGGKIVLDPLIKQAEGVFTAATYREFFDRAGRVLEQMNESAKDFQLLKQEYFQRLPIHFFAQCPYCDSPVLQPLDSFSLLGFHPALKIDELYWGRAWDEGKPPRQRCRHALLSTFSVNLEGQGPDDLPGWALRVVWGAQAREFDAAPIVMVWPLIARQTSAVVHALPMGRLDDPEPIHRYTAYCTTYFVGDESNLYEDEMWVPNDLGDAATGGVRIDTDLLKWVRAGRLYWMDPEDTSRLVKGPAEEFPYANIQPQGWYEFAEGGQVNGPRPYGRVWEGEAPTHDESFPKTIEYEWDEIKKKRHFWRPAGWRPGDEK